MIQVTANKIETAAQKAREVKPLVKFVAFRNYVVTNRETGATYQVKFDKVNGKPHAECSCKAGLSGKFLCYHVAASISHHLVIAAEMIR